MFNWNFLDHLLDVQAPKSWSKYTTVEYFFKKISKYTSILTALLLFIGEWFYLTISKYNLLATNKVRARTKNCNPPPPPTE